HVDKYAQNQAAQDTLLRQKQGARILLFLNFPAALFCAALGVEAVFRSDVTLIVQNTSDSPVQDLNLQTPEGTLKLGTMMPGEVRKRRIRFSGGGEVRYTSLRAGHQVQGPLESFIDEDDAHRVHLWITVSNTGISATRYH